MKINLLLACLFCCALASGQNFLNHSSKWHNIRGDHHDNQYRISNYEVIGDTLMEGKNYFLIEESYDIVVFPTGSFNPSTDTLFFVEGRKGVRLLREEAGRFYSRYANTNMEYVVVDFNLAVGDTIIIDGFAVDTITQIDTVFMAGANRRVFTSRWNYTLYEGIGTDRGLFEGFRWMGDEGIAFLKCYSYNNEIHEFPVSWSRPGVSFRDCEDLLTSTKEAQRAVSLQVYPNPAAQMLYIDSPNRSVLSIYTINGILQQQIQLHQGLNEIEVAQFHRGMYLFALDQGRERLWSKVVLR